jgi:transcription termination/antitermination protein NusA
VNLVDVIDGIVEERGLVREQVTLAVCEGIKIAYERKYPTTTFSVLFNEKTGALEVFAEKKVVTTVHDNDTEISMRRARVIAPKVKLGDPLQAPFEEKVGRIEVVAAKQIIAGRIRALEQMAVYNEFKDKVGTIVSGVVHKKERTGWVVKVGGAMAFIARENSIPEESLRAGFYVKALLKNVLKTAQEDCQLVLDRASVGFMQKLIELEIPEVFEGVVEIKKIVRSPGYKTKIIVVSTSKDIDPVGTCVGVGGARIKPILREVGQEKIDLISWADSLEDLVKDSLKPAEIDKVEVVDDARAVVWLAQDQRSLAIGKMGKNITLASRLVGLEIQLQDWMQSKGMISSEEEKGFFEKAEQEGPVEEGLIEKGEKRDGDDDRENVSKN